MRARPAATSECVWTHPFDRQRKFYRQIAGNRVRISLNSGFSKCPKVLLRVSVVPIIAFRREPTIDVITLSHREPAAFRAALEGSRAVGVLREETSALQADL